MAKAGDIDKLSILEKENRKLQESLNMMKADIKELNEINKRRNNADDILVEILKELSTNKKNRTVLIKKIEDKSLGKKLVEIFN